MKLRFISDFHVILHRIVTKGLYLQGSKLSHTSQYVQKDVSLPQRVIVPIENLLHATYYGT